KKIIIIIIIFLVFAWLYGWLSNRNKYFGNDVEDIKNTIMVKTGIKSNITVFDITDMDYYRIAGFINGDYDNDKMGYVVFKKEYPDNYIFEYIHVTDQSGDGIEVDFLNLGENNYSIVIANNTEFAQIKRVIAGVGTDIVKISHNPSLTLMQEPIHRNTSIAYYFYDEDGNEVE
ncbi:MAG TPA: hypothetical protein GXZ21_00070, partial [Clostridiales bacterium]|nr:hypothetical protein [Clostridiales bacterium]